MLQRGARGWTRVSSAGSWNARPPSFDLDGLAVRVASIDDLIAMKRAAGRPQDLVDLESLELARRRRRVDPGAAH
jgi:hypothetical protein